MEREEAIEVIRKNLPDVSFTQLREALETLIPELKESEDERIKEAIESIIRVYGKTQGEWIAGYDMDTLVVHLRDAFACLEKQNAAWSKGDSNIAEELYGYFWHLQFESDKEFSPSLSFDEILEWLKSIRPQPKQEWSVKDELAFTNSVDTLEYLGKFELADWLKEHKNQFLKPQNTWKPSEEQMNSLQEAIILLANLRRNVGDKKNLESLYNDLKKL